MRLVAAAITCCVLFNFFQWPALAQVEYSITDLGLGQANAINSSGQVAGQDGNGDILFYSDGSEQNLGVGDALGINDAGEVVGEYVPPNSPRFYSTAFLYNDGSMQTIGGNGYEAFGINNAGEVVGTVSQGANAWLYTGGTPQILGPGAAYAINNNGEIVGGTDLGPPCIYSNGTVQNLDPSLLFHSGHSSSASAVNDNGEIVGQDGVGNAFTYSNGSAQLIGAGNAYGVNSSGEIVGTSGGHGFVAAPSGTPQDLNTLIPSNSGWTITSANAINASGQIAANATLNGGQTHAVLLTPFSPQRVHILSYGVDWPSLNASDLVGLRGGKNAGSVSQAFSSHLSGITTNTLDDLNWASSTNITTLQNSVASMGQSVQPGDLAIIYICTHGTFDPSDSNAEATLQRQYDGGSGYVTSSVATGVALQGNQINGSPDSMDAVEFSKMFGGSNWQSVNKLFIIDSCYAGGFWSSWDGKEKYLSSLPHSAIIAAAYEDTLDSYSGGIFNPGETFFSMALEQVLAGYSAQSELDFSSFASQLQAKLLGIETEAGTGFPADAQVLWGGGPIPATDSFYSGSSPDFNFDPVTSVPEPSGMFLAVTACFIMLRTRRAR